MRRGAGAPRTGRTPVSRPGRPVPLSVLKDTVQARPTPARAGSGPRYRGRFAPSPTGPLHFGSLVAATASYLQARHHGGEWLLRIEDIDPPRAMTGARDAIIEALRAHGFRWHGQPLEQSRQAARHAALVDRLLRDGLAYPCTCTRQEIAAAGARRGALGLIYPGTCRDPARRHADRPAAIRLRTDQRIIGFQDLVQGPVNSCLGHEVGDFVIRRADGLPAYALAVVADDHDQGITEVVRGGDLLPFTPAQLWLQDRLGFPSPRYLHVPVAVNAAGQKLSKQTGARALEPTAAVTNLHSALSFMGQAPPAGLAGASLADLWAWSEANWRPERVRALRQRQAPPDFF